MQIIFDDKTKVDGLISFLENIDSIRLEDIDDDFKLRLKSYDLRIIRNLLNKLNYFKCGLGSTLVLDNEDLNHLILFGYKHDWIIKLDCRASISIHCNCIFYFTIYRGN